MSKYKRWHDQIIERAKQRELAGCGEWHHIQPKSLGGSGKKSNLVLLTFREHFLVHWRRDSVCRKARMALNDVTDARTDPGAVPGAFTTDKHRTQVSNDPRNGDVRLGVLVSDGGETGSTPRRNHDLCPEFNPRQWFKNNKCQRQ